MSESRRRWALRPEIRDAIIIGADRAAHRLVAAGVDKEDAGDLIAAALGEVAEVAVETAGAPDAIGDLVDEAVAKIAAALVEAIRRALHPDPSAIAERAADALAAGETARARRLFEKATRVAERQAAKDPA